MSSQTLRNWVIPGLLVGVTAVCLFLVGFDEITGHLIDSTVQNLLAFVIGVLSNQLGSLTGGQQTQDVVRQVTNGAAQRLPPGTTYTTPSAPAQMGTLPPERGV